MKQDETEQTRTRATVVCRVLKEASGSAILIDPGEAGWHGPTRLGRPVKGLVPAVVVRDLTVGRARGSAVRRQIGLRVEARVGDGALSRKEGIRSGQVSSGHDVGDGGGEEGRTLTTLISMPSLEVACERSRPPRVRRKQPTSARPRACKMAETTTKASNPTSPSRSSRRMRRRGRL